MMTANVILLIPGYMPLWPEAYQLPGAGQLNEPIDKNKNNGQQQRQMQEFLQARLSLTQDAPQLPWQGRLCQLLIDPKRSGNRLPTLVEKQQIDSVSISDADTWVHADPVFLKADRDTATLVPPQLLGLDDASTQALIDTLNDFFSDDGIRFHCQDSQRWFMSGQNAHTLAAFPTSFVAHRSASAFLPEGDDSGAWRCLMSEIQMLLHTHPVNQERENKGLMPVNSVWFWGGAPLAEKSKSSSPVRLIADDPYAVVLSDHLQIKHDSLAQMIDAAWVLPEAEEQNQTVVVVDTRLVEALLSSDAEGVVRITQQINEQIIKPLVSQVLKSKSGILRLHTEDALQGLCSSETVKKLKMLNRKPRWWNHLLRRS